MEKDLIVKEVAHRFYINNYRSAKTVFDGVSITALDDDLSTAYRIREEFGCRFVIEYVLLENGRRQVFTVNWSVSPNTPLLYGKGILDRFYRNVRWEV